MLPSQRESPKFEPLVSYNDKGDMMSIKAKLPKDSLNTYNVTVNGNVVTIQYGSEEEEKKGNCYTKRSYSRSYSYTAKGPIKDFKTEIGDDDSLIVKACLKK